jgi:hypothetical protein
MTLSPVWEQIATWILVLLSWAALIFAVYAIRAK